MLYLAYPAPHTPWLPSEEFKGTTGAGMYGDFMAMVDANVKKVMDAFESAGMMENTLIIFTSDNSAGSRADICDEQTTATRTANACCAGRPLDPNR